MATHEGEFIAAGPVNNLGIICAADLLDHYFSQAPTQLWPNALQENAVRGKGPYDGCLIWDQTYFSLLDPTNTSVTLHTLQRAAVAIGRQLRLELI